MGIDYEAGKDLPISKVRDFPMENAADLPVAQFWTDETKLLAFVTDGIFIQDEAHSDELETWGDEAGTLVLGEFEISDIVIEPVKNAISVHIGGREFRLTCEEVRR